MKQGAEMDSPLQTVYMCLLEGILGVKRTTPNWSVLREATVWPRALAILLVPSGCEIL